MRPVNLTISAFGPYAGKIEIDFEKIGENGLYLITGETLCCAPSMRSRKLILSWR